MASDRFRFRRHFSSRLETLEERLALATFTVLNTADSGAGSLRQAILDANLQAGPDLIAFNIGGIPTITPSSSLPTITDPVTIDGTTQPGFLGAPIVEISGTNAGPTANGLVITAGSTTVRGLVINQFALTGIVLSVGDGNVIEGNYIGTDVNGAIALGNGAQGVEINDGSAVNRIGTNGDGIVDLAERNVISGNGPNSLDADEIRIWRLGSDNNIVAGNYLGVDVTGTVALARRAGHRGVVIARGAQNNRIGTDGNGVADEAERNVISGNGSGILMRDAGTNNNLVGGNYIGVDATGSGPAGNLSFGIVIQLGAQGNQIGGSAALGNVIAFNGSDGVMIVGAGTVRNRVQANSIYSNGMLGIDLIAAASDPVGVVTMNDVGDADSGANQLQNYPVINVAHSGSKTFIAGTLNSLPNTLFTLDFYATPSTDQDPSGYGEGARYLGSLTSGTNASGNGVFDVLLDAETTVEDVITVTATSPNGSTSEFSAAVLVTTLTVSGTFGDDSFEFGRHASGGIEVSLNGLPQGVAAKVFVSDPLGSETYTVNFGGWDGFIEINDQGTFITDTLIANGTLGADVIVKVADQVTFGSPVTETVAYAGIENVVVDGGFGDDTITDPGTNTTILGGPGDDAVIIDATYGNGVIVDGGDGSDTYVVQFGNLAGPVTVADSGTTGSDSLTVEGTPGADSFTLTSNRVQNGSETVIIANPIDDLTVEGGGGSDSTTIVGYTAPISTLTVDGSGGANMVTIQGDPPPGVTLNLVAAVQTVQIEVRQQSLNLASNGVIAVAMFTTASFNAATVDVGSVIFAGAHAVRGVLEDADGDGDLDLILHFRTQDTNLHELYAQLLADDINEDGVLDSSHQQASVSLTGQTLDDRAFEGLDELDLFLSGKALRQMLQELAAVGAI